MLGDDLDKIWPLIYDGQSDSASFDNALELLVMGGYSLAHAMMLMIPEAWAGNPLMDEDRRAFYEYHAALMEPWDGPAAMAFTDGRQIGATLDRNGLRPARFVVTDDDYIVMASEVGVLDIPERKIVKKWRLQPGRMLLVDLDAGPHRRRRGAEAHARDRAAVPRLDRALRGCRSRTCPSRRRRTPSEVPLLDRQQAFGYTQEDLKVILAPMAQNGEEAVGSMGNDAALPVLSDRPKVFYNYFKQLFAQVTNPPIDPIREELVMSLVSFIGPRPNLLGVDGRREPPMRLEAQQPILTADEHGEAAPHRAVHGRRIPVDRARHLLPGGVGRATAWRRRSRASLRAAEDAIHQGYNIIILSDRCVSARAAADPGAARDGRRAPAPGASKGLRTAPGSSSRRARRARSTTSRCSPATAPRRSIRTSRSRRSPTLARRAARRRSPKESQKRYIKAICKGLYKVMSKMGISTYQSYCGAQIFEAVGLQTSLRRQVFHRHREHDRGHRPVRGRRGGAAPARAGLRRRPAARDACSTPAASTRTACAARSTCGRPTRSPSCSTRRARTATRPTATTRR